MTTQDTTLADGRPGLDAVTTAVDTNLAAYGNPDPRGRRAQLEAAWRADGRLIDPPIDGTGVDGIDAMMAAVQSQFPADTFRRTSAIDTHHGVARYSWAMVDAAGRTAIEGLDVADVDDDGRLVRIAGFMGPLTSV